MLTKTNENKNNNTSFFNQISLISWKQKNISDEKKRELLLVSRKRRSGYVQNQNKTTRTRLGLGLVWFLALVGSSRLGSTGQFRVRIKTQLKDF